MITEREIINGMRQVRRSLTRIKKSCDKEDMNAAYTYALDAEGAATILRRIAERARTEGFQREALPVPREEGLPDHLRDLQ